MNSLKAINVPSFIYSIFAAAFFSVFFSTESKANASNFSGAQVHTLSMDSQQAYKHQTNDWMSGHWTGSGQLTTVSPFLGNKTYPCSKIDIEIEHTSSQLIVNKYDARCDFLGSDWGPHAYEIRGDKVFEDGEETGTFVDNLFKTLSRSGSVEYAFNLRLRSETQNQQEVQILDNYYGTRNMTGTVVIEAALKKLP